MTGKQMSYEKKGLWLDLLQYHQKPLKFWEHQSNPSLKLHQIFKGSSIRRLVRKTILEITSAENSSSAILAHPNVNAHLSNGLLCGVVSD